MHAKRYYIILPINWENNKCIHCGIERQKKEWKWKRYYSGERNGVCQDIPYYTYDIGWYYGDEHKFKRPECIRLTSDKGQYKGISKEEILKFAPVLNKLDGNDKNSSES